METNSQISLSKHDPSITQKYLLDNFVLINERLYKPVKTTQINKYGHQSITIKSVSYPLHRVLMLMQTGNLPEHIDHIDGDPKNNYITNLRPATHAENMRNRRLNSNSTTGVKNVRIGHKGKYVASIQINKQKIHLGTFDNLELAELVATEAREKFHGKYARHS